MRMAMMTSILAAVSCGSLLAGEATPGLAAVRTEAEVLEVVESAAPASALVDVIVHGAAGKSFAELPAELQHAVRNTLAAHPDDATKARALAAVSEQRDVPTHTLEELERVQHPRVLALLAVQARGRRDFSRSEHLASVVTALDDPRCVEAYAVLAENGVISVYEANDRTYALALRLGEGLAVDRFAPVLSDFESTPQERSVAAFALAGAHQSDAARAALEKALAHAIDPDERRNLESALTRLDARE